ncbi:MAG: hypothetical protein H6867_09235 [Rhodospirillales bacterium]|nr:hypothetical protein [Rhodospirillales bacterium]
MKKLRYVFEGLSLSLLMIIFKLMPLDTASAVGGFIGRSIGPRLAASRKALRNIELALPELSPEQRQAALPECGIIWGALWQSFLIWRQSPVRA